MPSRGEAGWQGARLPWPPRLRYGTGAWVFVFPLGMYSMAGQVLGTAAKLPLIQHVGAAAVWPATAAWALTALTMTAAALARRRSGRTEPGATAPARALVAVREHR
jgi:tellurite resistance protein TehA-like permease